MSRNKNTWFFDFETFTKKSDYYKKYGHVGLGLFYGENLYKNESDSKQYNINQFYNYVDNESVSKGVNIEQFYHFVDNITKRQALEIGYHNLRFDISYVIKYFFNKCTPQNQQKSSRAKLKHGQFTSFTNFFGSVFKYEFKLPNRKYKVTFIDTLKILPASIKELSPYTPYQKFLDLDIHSLPEVSTWEQMPDEWKKRIINDVKVGKFMWLELKNSGLPEGMTAASIAFKDMKKQLGKKYYHHYACIASYDDWLNYQHSYKGGLVYANPNFTLDKIHHLSNKTTHTLGMLQDIRSSYPNQAVNFEQPYGNPVPKDSNTLNLLKINICDIKLKTGRIPFLQIESNKLGEKKTIISEHQNWLTLTIWENELNLVLQHYDCNYTILQSWSFKKDKSISVWFQKMYDKKKQAELENNQAMVKILKIYINAPTGKFGQNPKSGRKVWKITHATLNDDNNCNIESHTRKLQFDTTNDNKIHECDTFEISDKINYIPLISHITSGARIQLIEFINYENNYQHFRYCDTDSIVFCCQEKIKLPPTHKYGDDLGNWNIEIKDINYIQILREKAYRIKGINPKTNLPIKKTALSGLDKDVANNIKDKDFSFGYKTVRLKQVKTEWGIMLSDTIFEIKKGVKGTWKK